MAIPCTACQYSIASRWTVRRCLACPQGGIPGLFDIYNVYLMFREEERSRMFYSSSDEKARGDACMECGECLEKCPQGIAIPEWMKKVHEALGTKTA